MTHPSLTAEQRSLQVIATEKLKAYVASKGSSRRDEKLMRDAQRLITEALMIDYRSEAS